MSSFESLVAASVDPRPFGSLSLDALLEVLRTIPVLYGLIVLGLLVLLVWIGRRVARASEAASYTEIEPGPKPASEAEGEMTVMDFRDSIALEPLRRSFPKVRSLLRSMLPGRQPIYQLPWFLCIGASWAGKTTLLGQTRQALPRGLPGDEPGTDPPGLDWWIFDRGVVLDVRGDLVLGREEEGSDQPGWQGFLKLLRASRRRRPADGVILVLPVGDLEPFAASDSDTPARLAERANVLRKKLWLAQEQLGMRLPVWVVVTKCDHLPGFAAFTASLSAMERDQIFGWSNPEDATVPYQPGWTDAVFDSLRHSLYERQVRGLGSGAAAAGDRDLLAFPAVLDQLEEPLRIHLNQIFSDTASYEPFPLRGVYFCGGEGFAATTSPPLRGVEGEQVHPAPTAGHNIHRKVHFLADLFSRKVFPEWHLAVPTLEARQRRARQVWITQVLLLTLLFGGPLALLWAGRSTDRDAQVLADHVLVGAVRTVEERPASTQRRAEQVRALLRGVRQVPDYRLRRLALVPSWRSAYGGAAGAAFTDLYQQVVFPTTRALLDQRLTALAGSPGALESSRRIFDVTSTPELALLRQLQREMSVLGSDVRLYNCFSQVKCATHPEGLWSRFRQLSEEVYGIRGLVPPTRAARHFHGEALRGVALAPLRPSLDAERLRAKTRGLSRAMYRRLFEQNVLSVELRELRRRIENLAWEPPLPGVEQTRIYEELLAALDRVEVAMSTPELAWSLSESLELGPEHAEWLRWVMSERALQGPELAKEIRQDGENRFAAFRAGLEELEAEALGPLLVRTEEGAPLELSPQVRGLRLVLESLLRQKFMDSNLRQHQLSNTPEGQYLVWQTRSLERAVGLYQSFESFLGENLEQFAGLEAATRDSLRGPVEANMLEHIAEAQSYRPIPPRGSRSESESFLLEQVVNLQEASTALGELLDQLDAPPRMSTQGGCAHYCMSRSATAWCQLTAVVENQQRTLLAQAAALLEGSSLYTPGELSSWSGAAGENLAWTMFGVRSEDQLTAYLRSQRQRARSLAERFARPILTAVETSDCWSLSTGREALLWRVVLTNLEDYENKTPGNALDLVEDFVEVTLAATSAESCLSEIRPRSRCFTDLTPADLQLSPPCDFFLDRQARLERDAAARCAGVTVERAVAAWAEVTLAFNHRLRGKYPFVAGPAVPRDEEATPADVFNFLEAWEAHRPAVARYLSLFGVPVGGEGEAADPLPASPAAPAHRSAEVTAVGDFLRRADEVRDFFRFFVAQRLEEGSAVPTFDLQVEFRVNQDHEIGGNQIVRWAFVAGTDLIRPGDLDPPGRWAYGQPVALAVDWANDAPTLPLAPAEVESWRRPDAEALELSADPRRSVPRLEGRRVIWEYRNPWSLLALLREHGAQPRDFTEFVDPHPRTLRLEVPTAEIVERAVDSETGEVTLRLGKVFTTQVFVRVTLVTPDDAKRDLKLPDFPVGVPDFPSE